jgi:hypothetical protein
MIDLAVALFSGLEKPGLDDAWVAQNDDTDQNEGKNT